MTTCPAESNNARAPKRPFYALTIGALTRTLFYHQIPSVNSAVGRTQMRLLATLALLLALLLGVTAAAQVRKGRRTSAPPKPVSKVSKAPAAPKTSVPGSGRTVVCIDPGHPSEVASGRNIQNGTSEAHVDWVVATKLREELEARGYEVVLTKSS